MKEKIRLKNGQEFEIIPMGIEVQGNRRIFKFVSELSYPEVLEVFANEDNISKIEYILADGTTGRTYLDCVSLKALGFNPKYQVFEDATADVFIVEISIDAVERVLKALQNNMTYTELALVEIYESMLGGI